ncbi:right-handed parallel beta-helix repeat-containing protein, partial [Verrucomicrobiota bacterium]
SGDGAAITVTGGADLTVSNCLAAAYGRDAIDVVAGGAVAVFSTTLADNGLTGLVLSRTGSVTVRDSIAWGNAGGGIDTNAAVSYTCAQEAHAGAGNMVADPLFVADYYLAHAGLPGQTTDSPGVDAGSDTAAALGLSDRTTRTDGTPDALQADIGYHYAEASSEDLTYLDIYVDTGPLGDDDLNDGRSAASPFKTVTKGLDTAIKGSTIHVASGLYTNETFPLVIPEIGVSLVGANPATTVVQAPGSAANRRVLSAEGKGLVRIEGLTIRGGYVYSGTPNRGAGMLFVSCQALVRNCIVTDNTIYMHRWGVDEYGYGAGIYADGGSLTLAACVVSDNAVQITLRKNTKHAFGAGIYATAAQVRLEDCLLADNHLYAESPNEPYHRYMYGAALAVQGGDATVVSSVFTNNAIHYTGAGQYVTYVHSHGGAIYGDDVAPLHLADCTFQGNGLYDTVNGQTRVGGVLYLEGEHLDARLTSCTLQYNGQPGVTIPAGEIQFAEGSLRLRDTVVLGSPGSGVLMESGTLTVTNGLLAANVDHGIGMAGGTAGISGSTLADNGGWGLWHAGATVTLRDTILWGNVAGGSPTGGIATASACCAQNLLPGAGHVYDDPLFFHSYYLSHDIRGLQDVNSPCIDAGSDLASAVGMNALTTRTDGEPDAGQVDIGYHFEAAAEGDLNTVFFVDAVNGTNTNTGLSPASPLQTIGAALPRTIRDSFIYAAAGRYGTNIAESTPLSWTSMDLTIVGAGRDATFITGDGIRRALFIRNRGKVTLRDLTIEDGRVANGHGAGIYAVGTELVLSNCVVRNSTLDGTTGTGWTGAGVYSSSGRLRLLNTTVTGNVLNGRTLGSGGGIAVHGGGLTLVGTSLEGNRVNGSYTAQGNCACHGGGVYSAGAALHVADSRIDDNAVVVSGYYRGHGYGGGLYMNGGSGTFTNAVFDHNRISGSRASGNNDNDAEGAAVYAVTPTRLDLFDCTFTGNNARHDTDDERGAALYLDGGRARAVRCAFTGNDWGTPTYSAKEDIYVSPGAALSLRNSVVESGLGSGVVSEGALLVTNALIAGNANHGVSVVAGESDLANVTLADNLGFGLSRAGGTVGIVDSIAWNNAAGGITSNENVLVANTCSQETLGGSGNMVKDPVFVYSYYLSAEGLEGQTTNSPCIDAGGVPADSRGLDVLTTRTDGLGDAGPVDQGYHYAVGATGVQSLVIYVDAVHGSDTNSGMEADHPLKTITTALSRAMRGSEIRIAAGMYTNDNETFPLSVADRDLALVGTNKAATVIHGDGVHRVVEAANKGALALSGLTIENGFVENNHGGGLYVPGTALTLTDCTIRDNSVRGTDGSGWGGAGVYSSGGVLDLRSVVVSNNAVSDALTNEQSGKGAGILVNNGSLMLRNCRLAGNRLTGTDPHQRHIHCYGGSVYAENSPVTAIRTDFTDNRVTVSGYYSAWAYGGALYQVGGSTTISNCTFSGNTVNAAWTYGHQASNGEAFGGAVLLASSADVRIVDALVRSNAARHTDGGTHQRGGALYIDPSFVPVEIRGCRVIGNGGPGAAGDTWIGEGNVAVTYTLFADNAGSGIVTAGGRIRLRNCTMADNTVWGFDYAGADSVEAVNCIAWGNSGGGIDPNLRVGVNYSCTPEAATHGGEGNIDDDPLFVDPAGGDYHIRSAGGSYRDAISRFVRDAETSPCLDAGDDSSFSREPFPNGGRINMGAYGNTPYASRTPFGEAAILFIR